MNKWISAWLTWLEHEKGREPSTRKLYERTILGFERDTAHVAPLDRLTTADLLSWLHQKGGSAGSYGNRVAALRSFYGYLADRKSILEDPSRRLEIPKKPPSPRTPVRNLEQKLEVLDRIDGQRGRRVGESRDMAVFLAETGLRVSDACAVNVKLPVPSHITVPRGRLERVVDLSPTARGALERLGGRFGIGARALQRRFEKADFHPDQVRHWHRVNIADRHLRDDLQGKHESPLSVRSSEPDQQGRPEQAVAQSQSEGTLFAVGRFWRLAEDVVSMLVAEARKQGKSWGEIAECLSMSPADAEKRFAS